MARIEVATHVEAPRERVWQVLTDWEGQPDWMVDASSVRVLGERRSGAGVQLRCRTNILGALVDDDLEITEWDEPSVLGVRHLGWVIRGVGAFELAPTAHGCHVTWWEEAQVPFGAVGDAAAGIVVVPWVTRVFRRSLARLKRVAEGR
ncbi:MAG TPA: SRPBCC family protein [Egibacteraceae bacterium]|nr:SRPBCC family protein [Egibacteraceae bacterium]